jgi:hypothetical protein
LWFVNILRFFLPVGTSQWGPGFVTGFSLVMMKRFEDAIQPIKEGLRRNEDVPYGLNALGPLAAPSRA